MFAKNEIGIDLGTANILIYSKSKGIILNEPSIVALNTQTDDVIAVGHEAKDMVGKTPQSIVAIRPLQNGVIADYDVTQDMLKELLKKVSKKVGFSLRKPVVITCTPTGSTAVERRAIHHAIKGYGAKQVFLIEEPIAAAIGAGLPVAEPTANVVIDIGGGTSEIGIISLGGVVSSHSIRRGGDDLDQDIIQSLRINHNLLIGEKTAEEIKMTIGYAHSDHQEDEMNIRGRDLITGLPKTITIHSQEVYEAIKQTLEHILLGIRETLENCPPELSGDIVERGLVLTGGGALLKEMKEWLETALKIPVHIAPDPLESVAIGTGKSLQMISTLEKAEK